MNNIAATRIPGQLPLFAAAAAVVLFFLRCTSSSPQKKRQFPLPLHCPAAQLAMTPVGAHTFRFKYRNRKHTKSIMRLLLYENTSDYSMKNKKVEKPPLSVFVRAQPATCCCRASNNRPDSRCVTCCYGFCQAVLRF